MTILCLYVQFSNLKRAAVCFLRSRFSGVCGMTRAILSITDFSESKLRIDRTFKFDSIEICRKPIFRTNYVQERKEVQTNEWCVEKYIDTCI